MARTGRGDFIRGFRSNLIAEDVQLAIDRDAREVLHSKRNMPIWPFTTLQWLMGKAALIAFPDSQKHPTLEGIAFQNSGYYDTLLLERHVGIQRQCIPGCFRADYELGEVVVTALDENRLLEPERPEDPYNLFIVGLKHIKTAQEHPRQFGGAGPINIVKDMAAAGHVPKEPILHAAFGELFATRPNL